MLLSLALEAFLGLDGDKNNLLQVCNGNGKSGGFLADFFAKQGAVWCNTSNFLNRRLARGSECSVRSSMFNLGVFLT